MPLEYVPVHVIRLIGGVSPTFGKTKPVETEIAGSPFLARVYRVSQTTVQRDEAQPGTATVDQMQRLSVLDPACPIEVNDIAYLPEADGSYTRAKVIRVRPYGDRCQYDLETGAEGTGFPPGVDVADDSSADIADAAPSQAAAAPGVDIADDSSADAAG